MFAGTSSHEGGLSERRSLSLDGHRDRVDPQASGPPVSPIARSWSRGRPGRSTDVRLRFSRHCRLAIGLVLASVLLASPGTARSAPGIDINAVRQSQPADNVVLRWSE